MKSANLDFAPFALYTIAPRVNLHSKCVWWLHGLNSHHLNIEFFLINKFYFPQLLSTFPKKEEEADKVFLKGNK